MFVDETAISVKAGRGGDGCVSFRREKYVPRGGPDGGDGGHGGSIIIRADRNVGSLLELRKTQKYSARSGTPGMGNNRTGPSADDVTIKVPMGTIIRCNGQVIADLTSDGQEFVAAKGGKGGRGNKSFASSVNQVPREFTYGEPGEEYELELELKLIADIGLAGLPNAGKSTILSRLSAATPRIADYPFTTLKPQLGLVQGWNHQSLVMADIPGLISGAHEGAGLGIEFLKHIERTSCLAHIVDLVPPDGSDPVENFRIIVNELKSFSEELAARPIILVGNKIDLPGAEEAALRLEKELNIPVIRISAVVGTGLDNLKSELFRLVSQEMAR